MRNFFGRFWAVDSFWHRRDPLAKLILAGGLVGAGMVVRNPLAFLILGGLVIALWTSARLPGRIFLGLVRSLSWLILVALLTGLFFRGSRIGCPTAAALWATALNLGRLFIFFALAGWLAGTTTNLCLLEGLLRLAAPLRYLGWDEEKAAFVLGLGLRLFPELLEAGERIGLAQRARGLGARPGLKARLLAAEALAVALFSYAFRRADELALAMRARGYGRHPRRPIRPRPALDRRDRLVFLAGPVAAILFFWLGRR
ncbi:MAG: energy-coupling factor transporter transmembrane protein EcfT [Firmicutes bacterium]|nr:energy-coupling factor transporter transmembrane protein EcfT [Bacillota bacterium]